MHFKRGILLLTCGWAMVLVAGYMYQSWLAHCLPKGDYGNYGLVLNTLLWIEILVISGIPYAVQRFVSIYPERMFGILRKSIRVQGLVTTGLFILVFLCAPLIAAIFNDPNLTFYFRIVSIDILIYGFYHLFAGFENGRKRFDRQAALLMVFALGRLFSGVIFTLFKPVVPVALLANPVGSLSGVAAWIFINRKIPKQAFDKIRDMIQFALPSLFYFLVLNLAYNLDIWIVKYFLDDQTLGDYNAALLLAKIPYLLFFSVGTIILPTVSSHLSQNQFDEARDTVAQSIRILWILILPVAFLLSANSHEVLPLLFGPSFIDAAPFLRLLMWSLTATSLIFLFTSMINADHKPHISLILTSIAILISGILSVILVQDHGGVGVCLGMLIGLGSGAVLTFVFMYRRFRVFMGWKSFVRITLCAALLWPATVMIPAQGIFVVLKLITAYVGYWGLLFLFREVHGDEISEIFSSNIG